MALSRIKVWLAGEVLTASDLNTEFNNILNNPISLVSPLTASLDLDGNSLILDAAGVTSFVSSTSQAYQFTPGAKSGTPSTTGAVQNWVASTFTDSATAGSGTATNFVAHAFQRPTLAASNASVTTTNAATLYIANAPLAGTNETLTNAYALWVDDGATRLDGTLTVGGNTTVSGTLGVTGATTLSGETTLSGKSIWMAEGAAVASDAGGTTNIWTTDGNTIHVTGTNAITSFGTAPQAGAYKMVIFDGALTLTHGANLAIPGSANITTAANDWCLVYADTTTQLDVVIYSRANGAPTAAPTASQGASEVLISDSGNITGTPSEVTFVSVYTSTYHGYRYDFFNCLPTTDAVIFQSQVAKSGSTWQSDATDYQLNGNGENSASGGDAVKSAGTTLISFTDDAVGVDNGAGNGVCGSMYVYAPSTAAKVKQSIVLVTYYDSSGNLTLWRGSFGFLDGNAISAGADAIVSQRFFWSSSSTFAGGRILLYGIKLS